MVRYIQVLGWFLAIFFLSIICFVKPIGKVVAKKMEREMNIAKEVQESVQEKHFVIVVPSYNNELYVSKNIGSICTQNYRNFTVIYVDDCSTDRTYDAVVEMVESFGMREKFTILRNKVNKMAMYNLYTMIHMCKDEDIVVILDGDDWFANEEVLSKLNRYYANPDVWLTYGQFIRYPDYTRGCSSPVLQSYLETADIRQDPWRYSHLRTFYASLFKKIELKDFLYEGEFLKATYDLAIMFPMIEMARTHAYFIPDILYVYNYQTPLNDAKVREALQKQMEGYIRGLPRYEKIESLSLKQEESVSACDVVAFSYNRPLQLYAFLESFYKYVKGYREVFVIYRNDEEYVEGYEVVKRKFPEVVFLEQKNPPHDFKEITIEAIFGEKGKGADHVVFVVDDVIVKEEIDLKKGMREIKEKGAYGFFYRLGDHVKHCYTLNLYQGTPPLLEFPEDVYGWIFEKGMADWAYPNTLDFTLYNKKEIKDPFLQLEYTNPNYLEGRWSNLANLRGIGLCHKHSKILNIPINIVSTFKNRSMHAYSAQELNRLFLSGLKCNIAIFEGLLNESAHTEMELEFINRKEEEAFVKEGV